MFTQLNAHLFNHLLSQNAWAAEQLRPFSGKVIRISITPLQTTLVINGLGEFEAAQPDSPIDAEIVLTPGAALRMVLQPGTSSNLAIFRGDTPLATDIGKVLRALRWDTEEDLSRVVGDIPAHALGQASRRIKNEVRRQAWSVAEMFAEYWLEEQPLIAKKRHLDEFSRAVDALRDDAERLAKRLGRLEKLS